MATLSTNRALLGSLIGAAASVAVAYVGVLPQLREQDQKTIATLHVRLEGLAHELSACRTAGARTFAGEGLVGLTWAFLSSGAGNVVAGLWNVEDASTAELMADLYRGLAEGQGPAEALRQAKLDLQASDPAYRKPFYWAPFVIYTRGPASSRRSARPSGT